MDRSLSTRNCKPPPKPKQEGEETMMNKLQTHTSFLIVLAVVCLIGLGTPSIGAIQQPQDVQKERTVKLNVLVTDLQNRPMNDVKQEEFAVFEDGVPQTISYFSKEERPLIYCLLVDASGSQRKAIAPIIEAAKTVVTNNRLGDETSLIEFREYASLSVEFTTNKNQLQFSLNDLKNRVHSPSAIRDAVYLATQDVAKYNSLDKNGLRTIVLISDGDDSVSHYKLEDTLNLLRKENIQVFAIGFDLKETAKIKSKDKLKKARELLNSLAQETGGQAFFPESPDELQSIANDLLNRMRTQYIIGYKSVTEAKKNSYHKVNVTIADASGRDKRIAITRAGYTFASK
jgi:Ca-activated chloride channel homolog